MHKRVEYSEELAAKVIEDYAKEVVTIEEVATRYGLIARDIRRWRYNNPEFDRRMTEAQQVAENSQLKFTPELGAEIARDYGSAGNDLNTVAQKYGITTRQISTWRHEYPEFDKAMDLAYLSKAKIWAEEIITITDDAEKNGADPRHTANRINARKWVAERLIPALYGNKTYVNHSGTVEVGLADRLLFAKAKIEDLRKNKQIEGDFIDVTPAAELPASAEKKSD